MVISRRQQSYGQLADRCCRSKLRWSCSRRCEGLIIKFQQKELDHEEWEQVDAGGAVDYAWEEPMFTHRLRIFIDSDAVAYKDNVLHEYNLDVIKVRPLLDQPAVSIVVRSQYFAMLGQCRVPSLMQQQHKSQSHVL